MIAFILKNTIICDETISVFEYVSRLKKLGIESDIFAEEWGEELEQKYYIKVRSLSDLNVTKDDVIVAVNWEQCEKLNSLDGKKFQFIFNDDLKVINQEQHEQCSYWRRHPDWNLIGVSSNVLMNWGRGEVVLNGLNGMFFEKKYVERDIDILIDGNNELKENIDKALIIARSVEKKSPGIKIALLINQEYDGAGVEIFNDIKQEEKPSIYQRAKVIIKVSGSDCSYIPILEAMASGVLVVTTPIILDGEFCVHEKNCLIISLCIADDAIMEHINSGAYRLLVDDALETAESFNWDSSVQYFLSYTGK